MAEASAAEVLAVAVQVPVSETSCIIAILYNHGLGIKIVV